MITDDDEDDALAAFRGIFFIPLLFAAATAGWGIGTLIYWCVLCA